ncbi:cell division protein ZapE [Methylotuvimicrobium alcaliphilum]|uniref:AFG1-family ATPase n=2 Tax=Methylotuvimicrobium alcaliphilum TaxID=271065 RepID=G4T350_META2|nr:cell division protein ZapE [Methylotuvimicrobium alcaliphilum]CCE24792.1 AFG1-family ATPase [Methylotuvimicrobium alcaliphilum 20Z]
MFKKFLSKMTPAQAKLDAGESLLVEYRWRVEQGLIDYDPAQVEALHYLQEMLDKLTAENRSGFLSLSSARGKPCKSLYIYGGVGRGKSMLMDLFYDHCPIQEKRRVHFHTFILEVHEFSHRWRQEKKQDIIHSLAAEINASTKLLCFDEFHVIDVANAVILDRLFSRLFELGTVIVTTSNRHPDDLYQAGLVPELFLKFIELLKASADVVELVAKHDYRLTRIHGAEKTYFYPLDEHAASALEQCYRELTHSAPLKPYSLKVLGRNVVLRAAHGDVAFTTFDEVCRKPLGPADYLKIVQAFRVVIVSGIPRFGFDNHDEAKRFSTLVDALYFHKVILICSAEAPARELYDENIRAFFLKRTVSRLIEMQSDYYLKQ